LNLPGGLETFEYIGKKTMEVLQENDPGLRRKRELLHGGKSTLSDLLQEARESNEAGHSSSSPSSSLSNDRSSVVAVFEELGGLTHFEALSTLKDTLELKCLGIDGADDKTRALFEKFSFENDDDDGDEDDQDVEKQTLGELVESMTSFLGVLSLHGVNGKKVEAVR
jgi:hypothetical protein